jgi:hypothetical protein
MTSKTTAAGKINPAKLLTGIIPGKAQMMVTMAAQLQRAQLPRCTMRGCPVRFADGPDRPCRDHSADDRAITSAALSLGIHLDAIPGAYDDGQHDGG